MTLSGIPAAQAEAYAAATAVGATQPTGRKGWFAERKAAYVAWKQGRRMFKTAWKSLSKTERSEYNACVCHKTWKEKKMLYHMSFSEKIAHLLQWKQTAGESEKSVLLSAMHNQPPIGRSKHFDDRQTAENGYLGAAKRGASVPFIHPFGSIAFYTPGRMNIV